MLLYHGTNGRWLPSVLRFGLRPRGRSPRNNWQHSTPSNPHAVYLTNSYAPHFAFTAARGTDQLGAVIEVDTARLPDQELLLPDEDAWEQLGRGTPGDGVPGNQKARTRWYRDQINAAARTRDPLHPMLGAYTAKDNPLLRAWGVSVRALGTCCYRGVIPPAAMTRAVVFPLRENAHLRLVWDAQITLANQQICGPAYRAKTARLFGDVPSDTANLSSFDRLQINFALVGGSLYIAPFTGPPQPHAFPRDPAADAERELLLGDLRRAGSAGEAAAALVQRVP